MRRRCVRALAERARGVRCHQTKESFSGSTVRQAAWHVTSCGLSASVTVTKTPRCRSWNELRGGIGGGGG